MKEDTLANLEGYLATPSDDIDVQVEKDDAANALKALDECGREDAAAVYAYAMDRLRAGHLELIAAQLAAA